MKSYTPGPWKPALVDIGGFRNGWMIDAIYSPGSHRKTGFIQIFADPENAEQMKEAEANAHAISAVPEMIEALECLIDGGNIPLYARAKIFKALAKARGEK
jgi:hypothetical protein